MADENKLLSTAKTQLLLSSPFFGVLLCKHPPKLSIRVPTAGVDARGNIYVNPDFLSELNVDKAIFMLAHEVMHMVWRHALREGNRDHVVWNIACDAVVNNLLKKQHIGKFIDGCVDMPKYADWGVEDVYEDLIKESKNEGKGSSDGTGTYDPSKDVLRDDVDGSSASEMTESEKRAEEAKVKAEIAAAATTAKMRGTLSNSMARAIGMAMETPVPWYELLEKFMVSKGGVEQSWRRPNKRFSHVAYLPSYSPLATMGEIVIGIDTSGSIEEDTLAEFTYHVNRILELVRPARVHVVFCDSCACRADTYEPDDFPLQFEDVPGGGGTDMREIFRWIDDEEISPEAVVILTDGWTPYPDEEEYPTLWAITPGDCPMPETGEVVRIR